MRTQINIIIIIIINLLLLWYKKSYTAETPTKSGFVRLLDIAPISEFVYFLKLYFQCRYSSTVAVSQQVTVLETTLANINQDQTGRTTIGQMASVKNSGSLSSGFKIIVEPSYYIGQQVRAAVEWTTHFSVVEFYVKDLV